jgi:hypothetical protein
MQVTLCVGAAVRLNGLRSKSVFEGRAGIVVELLRLDGFQAPSHAQVQLNDGLGGESLRVRVERLVPIVQVQLQQLLRKRQRNEHLTSFAGAALSLSESEHRSSATDIDLRDDDSDDNARRGKEACGQLQRTLQEARDAAFARWCADEEGGQQRPSERLQLDDENSDWDEDDEDESQPYDPAKDILYSQRNTVGEASQCALLTCGNIFVLSALCFSVHDANVSPFCF